MFRSLIDDFQDFPATMTLCALWVIVFALMVLDQVSQGSIPTVGSLFLVIPGGHPFGEMTLYDLVAGEIWRPLTATFVHYGLLHLGMNLFMMYQLGGLVESWYGPWQFLAIYVVIGSGANLLSAWARYLLGSDPRSWASGGGSTVILGLAALCAVVGWRSRSRTGDYLRSQMVWLLIATAVLGQIVPIMDNWGHAAGALIGAAIGFAHRILIRTVRRPAAQWAGILGVLLLIASASAQTREYRVERAARRLRAAEQTVAALQQIERFYILAVERSRFEHRTLIPEVFRRSPRIVAFLEQGSSPGILKQLSVQDSSDKAFRDALSHCRDQLEALHDDLATGPTAADYQQLEVLLAQVFDRLPTDRIVREFIAHLGPLFRRARQQRETALALYVSLRRQSHAG